MKVRTHVIQWLIEKYDYQNYLEIGVAERENFRYIKIPGTMHGVDIKLSENLTHLMTSDKYFAQCDTTFDIIFIDGLHHADQAYKDANNALGILNEGGTIVMHDCSPPTEAMQMVPRTQPLWCGDVWRAWLKLRRMDNLSMEVVDLDWGVGIIQRGKQTPIGQEDYKMSYADFDKDRKRLLNLVPPNYILGEWV